MTDSHNTGVRNGMSAVELGDATWRKSSRSGAVGNCVELAWPERGVAAVRNSRDPRGPVLVYERADLVSFLERVKTS
ncbi:DUF397 domain-containing protein [Actinophytocola gossypii]|uniref:DUF397 domain-containing protein n=1 Tax=Actinophytocola gossypii TaxID=2812003 RepID=A0ABT2JJM1_9PSEU|nr:DUF397 domain-containing protein [Actinophytocola gossypii]MCT2588082.1 DUF397 domain-containing protein [Actinophytocola gossypii]